MIPRRVALQLTPLLDLLLIVIFAQYLDVGERDRQRIASTEQLEEQTAQLEIVAREAIERSRQSDAIVESVTAELEATRASLRGVKQAEIALAEAAAGIFNIPSERIEAALNPFSNPSAVLVEDERAEIRKRLQQITSGDEDAVVLHLLTHEELRKRVDLWRLHIDERNVGTLEAGGRKHTFRVMPSTIAQDIGLYADTLPDPKRLVVMLFTYDASSRLITIESVRDQLPPLMERLTQNSDSRFDYADLGFREFESNLPNEDASSVIPPPLE